MKFWFGKDDKKQWMEEYFTDYQKDLLRQFADNEDLKETVRMFLLAGLNLNGTIRNGQGIWPDINALLIDVLDPNFKFDDTQLGQRLRARAQGLIALQSGFKEIEKFKTKEALPKPEESPHI